MSEFKGLFDYYANVLLYNRVPRAWLTGNVIETILEEVNERKKIKEIMDDISKCTEKKIFSYMDFEEVPNHMLDDIKTFIIFEALDLVFERDGVSIPTSDIADVGIIFDRRDNLIYYFHAEVLIRGGNSLSHSERLTFDIGITDNVAAKALDGEVLGNCEM